MSKSCVGKYKVAFLLAVVFIYAMSGLIYTITYRNVIEETAWNYVRDSGIMIRADAIIVSPTITYRVNCLRFVSLAKLEGINTVFFLPADGDNVSNRLVLIIDSTVGYIYEPIPLSMDHMLRSFLFSLPDWSPDR